MFHSVFELIGCQCNGPRYAKGVHAKQVGAQNMWWGHIVNNTPQFAGPPAHGVSDPGHSSSVPSDFSLRVLDSSPGVQKDTIYGVLGRGLGR